MKKRAYGFTVLVERCASDAWVAARRFLRPSEARLLDLRDYPVPFFDQVSLQRRPAREPYENEVVKRWTAEIAASDRERRQFHVAPRRDPCYMAMTAPG